MPWMTRWPGSFPVSVASAQGGRLVDADGLEYVDLCLGDTGAMTGHALPAVTEAVASRVATGATAMLPSRGRSLGRCRAGPPVRAAVLAARDLRHRREPVRAPLRPPPDRAAAGRGHGLVLPRHRRRDAGRAGGLRRASCRAPAPSARRPTSPTTTAVVPFNDLGALDRRLAEGDVACLLMEPALTNIGIVLPAAGYSPASARSPGGTACCW